MDLTVTYADERATAALEVHAADSRLEFQRWRLRERASDNGHYTGATAWLHSLAWPDMASTVTGELTLDGTTYQLDRGHPLPFDVYLKLPEPLAVELEDTVYQLNPQWVIKPEPDSQKKEVTNSTAG